MNWALYMGMTGEDLNNTYCALSNVILGQVTLSPTWSHLLQCTVEYNVILVEQRECE